MRRGPSRRQVAGRVALVAAAGLLAACTATAPTPGPTSPVAPTTGSATPEAVTVTWWYREGGAALADHWRAVADEFEAAHPQVTVDLHEAAADAPPPAAGDLPDVVGLSDVAWLADLVADGAVRDLTDDLAPEIEASGGAASAYRLAGRTYAVPWTFFSFGFWYDPEVFARAGVDGEPASLDELLDVVTRLRAAGVVPVAIDGADGFTEGQYWEELAVRICPAQAWPEPGGRAGFDDPCFVAAGAALERLLAAAPFEPEALTASPGGADDAHELVATGQAGMLLSGTWAPGLMRAGLEALGRSPAELPELGWFPFPAEQGGPGDPTTVVGDGNAFAVSADAPPEAVELVRAAVGRDAQVRQVEATDWVPVAVGAVSSADRNLQPMLEAVQGAGQARLRLGHVYGTDVMFAMSTAVVDLFLGRGTAQGVVDAMNAVAGGG